MSSVDMRSILFASQRILILGAPGSGKTTFAKLLAAKTGLPLLSLDDIYWESGWRRVKAFEFVRDQERFIRQSDNWIVDGLHMPSLPTRIQQADAVVLIEVPVWVALAGFIWRGLLRRCGRRASLPQRIRDDRSGRLENWIAGWRPEWKILRTIISFRGRYAPAIVAMAQAVSLETGNKIVLLRLGSRYQCRRLLKEI